MCDIVIIGVSHVEINTKNIASITEANQNFSKIAKMVDQFGTAVILKNNRPKYVIVKYDEIENMKNGTDQKVELAARQVLEQNLEAFNELAK